MLVGASSSLIPNHSRVLVSEAVNNKDLEQERAYIPRLHATLTGPTDGPDDGSDCTTDVNAFLARSSDEVHPRHLPPDKRADFDAADAAEWKATVESGSVTVLDSVAANAVRRERPDRVINSRMVRRLKPQEGTFQKPMAKSRGCVLEHQGLDAANMFTYAPTPQTENIMLFLFILQVCGLTLSIADLKNACCQSNSLDRSAGPLFVEPCEGLDLPSGSLIQLVAPVYGLNDAPLRWHRTSRPPSLPMGFSQAGTQRRATSKGFMEGGWETDVCIWLTISTPRWRFRFIDLSRFLALALWF